MTENDPKDTTSVDPIETKEAASTASSSSESSPATATAEASSETQTPTSSGEQGEREDEGGDDEGDDDGGDEADGSDASAGESATGEGEGGKKKRRRRRRKKKGALGLAGDGTEGAESPESGSAGGAGGGGGRRPPREQKQPNPHAPFARWFDGQGERKHAFSAGEIVAGMVTRVEDGAALVDLFGKAVAVVDVLEPREIEPIPEPVAPVAAEGGAEAPEGAEAAAEGDAVATDAAAPVEGAEAVAAPVEGEATTEVVQAQDALEAAPSATSAGDVAAVEAATIAEAEAATIAEAEDAVEEEDTSAHDAEAHPTVANASAAPPELGEVLRGRIASVSESGHVVLINRYIEKGAARERIREHQTNRRRVAGVVYGFNRGGFDVIVEGIRVFCPASAMALDPITDPVSFVGRKLEFTLPPSKGGRSIVVSRRTLLEREQRRLRRDVMKALEVGTRRPGRVTGIREYGVLVDIGEGLEGLVHLSELGWSRGTRPSDVGPVGTEVEVEVTKVIPISRKERFGKIGLSIRACQPDPWEQHKEILSEGHAQLAKVTRTAEFGAFLELAPGLEGMLHISELGGRDLKHANQVLKEGESLAVLVERVDRQNRRISLSKLSPAEAEQLANGSFASGSSKAPKPGSTVNVVIEKVEHHGLIVQVVGVPGRRGRGYLSNRDMGELSGDKRQRLAPGGTLEVKIVGTDRDGSLKCSVKAKQIDEERNAVRDYKRESARQGFGTFGDLLRQKLQR